MTYYLSAFCTDSEIPSLGQVQAWATGRTPPITVDPDEPPDCRRWGPVNVYYGPDDRAFSVDIYGPGDPPEYDWLDVLPGTIKEFRSALEAQSPTPGRDRVLAHLGRTRFLVSISVPLSQFAQDEVAWAATDLLLQYFVERRGGMVHAEGEGFYDHDGKLLVTVR
jgi:hypothetical protein